MQSRTTRRTGGKDRSWRSRTAAFAAAALMLLQTAPCHADPPVSSARPVPPTGGTIELKVVRQTTTFGTLGFVDGQTVRLSAVRAGEDTAKICHVDLNFFDLQSNRQGAGVSTDLQPGHAAFLDLARADVEPQSSDPRAQVYAVVDVESEPAGSGNPKDDKPACHVAMSIEIVDQTDGRTQIYQGAFTANVKLGDVKSCCCICCETTNGQCTHPYCFCNSSPTPPACPTLRDCP
jgi:hypothetical protein